MKILPHDIFQTNIATFDISDEPVFHYLLELNKRMPDEISEEENITNSLGNTSSYGSLQRNIKMYEKATWNAYEDEEWICVRKEVLKFLNGLGKLFIEMHHNTGIANWIKNRKFGITNLWMVRYKEGDYQSWHTHPQSSLSAVLFLEVPEGINPKTFPDGILHLLSNGNYDEQTLEINKSYFVKPEPGLLIIFPSSIGHLAYPFKGPGRRTVISFNYDDDKIMNNASLDKKTGKYLLSGPNDTVYELTEYLDDK